MNIIERATAIGIENAEMAFDQRRDFRDLADAVDSFRENVEDSLVEQRILTDATLSAAVKAFQERIAMLTK